MGKPKVVIVSGYFNPLHKGHLELFEKANEKGDKLWVIVNSDLQRELKRSKPFMDEKERLTIIKAIGIVDMALISIDKDKTQRETLMYLAKQYGKKHLLFLLRLIRKQIGYIGIINYVFVIVTFVYISYNCLGQKDKQPYKKVFNGCNHIRKQYKC